MRRHVEEVADVTGVAEFLDGRVKTLHPAIHGGLLARRDRSDHLAALSERQIAPIDLLVCNLYPFGETVESGASPADCIENIDIGGVALIRAAAKNYDAVTVVTDPADYDSIVGELAASAGAVRVELRRDLSRGQLGIEHQPQDLPAAGSGDRLQRGLHRRGI